ncbi:MAG: 1-deoxy-D-xylulose-5-phosphate synthase [Candidatus Gygaella obscura]|nr:1-deoxy-D-xylulose-5-phosphate synthase [Candidatus Gygaella obscura]
MFLEQIKTAGDVKKLDIEQLKKLAEEIRKEIIRVVSINGGHPASSLGAVEIIIALHFCLDLELDKLIFDVGHQAYAHKLLTPREKEFSTLRKYGGLSGFPTKGESKYDIFTVGHSSNAVSLASGLACKDYKTVALIGDGSLSGGLCFEGLNNAGHLKKNMLVVLNTNEMSISPVVGSLSTYLNKIISTPLYNRFRQSLDNFIKEKIPRIGPRMLSLKERFEESFKNLLVPGVFFEEMGFRYFGPLDGHNLDVLIRTIKNILPMDKPVLLHVVTKKGKGYVPAQTHPEKFHSASNFDIQTGRSLKEKKDSYTKVFSRKIMQLASSNKKIVAITAAMPEGTGLDKFKERFPDRFFDVGIAEQHAVSFAAGLAQRGLRPVVAIYSTFLQRAYDQLMTDAALQELPIVFAIDRAGIVGQDGVTHQGIFDICYLRSIPNMVLMAPKDAYEFEKMVEFAFLYDKGPVAIRYPRDEALYMNVDNEKIELGVPEVISSDKKVVIFAIGTMVKLAVQTQELLKEQGIKIGVVNARFVKPLDKNKLNSICQDAQYIFSIEEGALDAGFGSCLQEALGKSVIRFGLPCEFITHGTRKELLRKYGLDASLIAEKITKIIKDGKDKDK